MGCSLVICKRVKGTEEEKRLPKEMRLLLVADSIGVGAPWRSKAGSSRSKNHRGNE